MSYAKILKLTLFIIRAEREKYYKHGFKARYAPEKYLSIIIDGMDQSKHNLPHFQVTTKVIKVLVSIYIRIYKYMYGFFNSLKGNVLYTGQ